MNLQTNLSSISTIANNKQTENDRFIELLLSLNNDELDTQVFELNNSITPQINCTNCGNCCKSLMVNINDTEANNAAHYLQITREKFDDLYVEKSLSGKMIMNTMPCNFLSNNVCTIYEHRFAGCKEFPALHLPNFKQRLFTVFMHYNRCPIIFNVIEQLKEKVRFIK